MNVYVQPTVSTQKPPGLQGSGVGRPRSSIDSALRPCLTWGEGLQLLQEGGPLPGPKSGLLSNIQK